MLGVGEFQAGGKGNGAAVGGVEGIEIDVAGHAAGAANAADDANLLRSVLDSSSARVKQLTVVPMPQPGHQMCGMRSVRRKGFHRVRPGCWEHVSTHRAASHGLQNVFRLVHGAAGVAHVHHAALSAGAALHLAHHLAEIQFGNHQRLHLAARSRG